MASIERGKYLILSMLQGERQERDAPTKHVYQVFDCDAQINT
jgi:hypothetical protein